MDIEDLEDVIEVVAVVGKNAGPGNGEFDCEGGKYGKEGGKYYLAVEYDEVKKSAKPATMMDAKWLSGSKWKSRVE